MKNQNEPDNLKNGLKNMKSEEKLFKNKSIINITN